MNKYVKIQMQSPIEGAGFVAQWYAGGERSGQAFPLSSVGELRLDRLLPRGAADRQRRGDPCDAARARIQRAQPGWLNTPEQAATRAESPPAAVLITSHWTDIRTSGPLGSSAGYRVSPP
jgi:hypothetical protein